MLVNAAEAIETFVKVETPIADKTGTLTLGRPELITVEPAEGVTEPNLLADVAAV